MNPASSGPSSSCPTSTACSVQHAAQQRLRTASVTVERMRAALPKATPEQRRALLRELVRSTCDFFEGKRKRLPACTPAKLLFASCAGEITA